MKDIVSAAAIGVLIRSARAVIFLIIYSLLNQVILWPGDQRTLTPVIKQPLARPPPGGGSTKPAIEPLPLPSSESGRPILERDR